MKKYLFRLKCLANILISPLETIANYTKPLHCVDKWMYVCVTVIMATGWRDKQILYEWKWLFSRILFEMLWFFYKFSFIHPMPFANQFVLLWRGIMRFNMVSWSVNSRLSDFGKHRFYQSPIKINECHSRCTLHILSTYSPTEPYGLRRNSCIVHWLFFCCLALPCLASLCRACQSVYGGDV